MPGKLIRNLEKSRPSAIVLTAYLRGLLVVGDGGHDGAESPELGVSDVLAVLADDLPGAPLTRAPPRHRHRRRRAAVDGDFG